MSHHLDFLCSTLRAHTQYLCKHGPPQIGLDNTPLLRHTKNKNSGTHTVHSGISDGKIKYIVTNVFRFKHGNECGGKRCKNR